MGDRLPVMGLSNLFKMKSLTSGFVMGLMVMTVGLYGTEARAEYGDIVLNN